MSTDDTQETRNDGMRTGEGATGKQEAHGERAHDEATASDAGNDQAGSDQAWHERVITEEFKVSGEAVVAKVKELVREGNVRRIIFKNEEGKTLIEIPLTIGVIGTVLLPVWASIGAIAALVANLTITVERPAQAEQEAPKDVGHELGEPS